MNPEEAVEALAGGADIIDVKNPSEGALGAPFPRVIARVYQVVTEWTKANSALSAAVGDVPDRPGMVALAALGACVAGANYVKIGLLGVREEERATLLLAEAARSVREQNPAARVMAVGYADAGEIGAIHPEVIPRVSRSSGIDGAMIDTFQKDGRNLFDFLDEFHLARFIAEARGCGLVSALAGSLKEGSLEKALALRPDIIGFRGAVCDGDRVNGRVRRERVAVLANLVERAGCQGESL